MPRQRHAAAGESTQAQALANQPVIMADRGEEHAGPAAQSLAVVLFSLPLLFGGKAAAGVRILAVYGALCAVEWASALGVDRLPWLHIAGATAAGVCMMMPCLTAGMAMFATTRPGDMVCAMRRMRAPDALVIPVVVMMVQSRNVHNAVPSTPPSFLSR